MTVQFKNVRIKRFPVAARKVVLVAGPDSHGAGAHAHRAGCALFKAALDKVPGIAAETHANGWPKDPAAFDGAAAIVIYSDGGGGHPFIQGDRLKVLADLVRRGVGLGCVHYAVEVPKDRGGAEWLAWIGGYFETHWSVNPFWEADFKVFPDHPVSRGLKPFKSHDEWYYHMRFAQDMQGVTPILSALPPAKTLERPDGPHSNNPAVRAAVLERKEPQHLLWTYQRPDGGRGFGCTGGHYHKNWAEPNFRRAVLNAIVWTAKAEVPTGGVQDGFTAEDVMVFLK
ncbi:MAG: ThuA domain-containing protein [Verrucomicrobia bacterium]|nr:ThuA domain-containing protein [Verrucomicrobiota bacterium]